MRDRLKSMIVRYEKLLARQAANLTIELREAAYRTALSRFSLREAVQTVLIVGKKPRNTWVMGVVILAHRFEVAEGGGRYSSEQGTFY